MILATYPLEYFAASTPRTNPEATWELYAALAKDAGAEPKVRVNDGRVLTDIIEHKDGRRFAWFVSQSADALDIEPLSTDNLHARDDGHPVSRVHLAPYGVAVLEIRQSD